MAGAFYTYRHVELDRVGCGKRKVLKPPGGGSSDIFGTGSSQFDQAPARVNKTYASSIPLGRGEFTEETRKPLSIDSNDGSTTSTTSNGTPENSEPNTPRSGTPLLTGPIAYHDAHDAVPTPASRGRRTQGNPVTGEGYEGEQAKKEETPRRQRVPPGGFSSKLW